MPMRIYVYIVVSLWLSVVAQAQEIACESASCGLINGSVQNTFEPGWIIQFNGQYSSLTTGMDGDQTLANRERQSLQSSITQLSATYNFSPEYGLQLVVPYLDRSYRRTADDHLESGHLSGLGDITLMGRYTPIADFDQDRNFVWNLQAGVKLPTGSSKLLAEEVHHLHQHGASLLSGNSQLDDDDLDHKHTGSLLPPSLVGAHDLALGSGSIDALVGTGIYYRQKSLFLNAGAQYLMRSRGSYGYQYGNLFLWNFSPGFFISQEDDHLMGLQLNLSGEIKQQDNLQGLRIDHTGMSGIYAGPQLFMSAHDLNMQAAVDFPIKQHTDGATLMPDYRLRLQMSLKL